MPRPKNEVPSYADPQIPIEDLHARDIKKATREAWLLHWLGASGDAVAEANQRVHKLAEEGLQAFGISSEKSYRAARDAKEELEGKPPRRPRQRG